MVSARPRTNVDKYVVYDPPRHVLYWSGLNKIQTFDRLIFTLDYRSNFIGDKIPVIMLLAEEFAMPVTILKKKIENNNPYYCL